MARIRWELIGKESSAHLMAQEVARDRKKARLILGEKEVLGKIKKTEVGKRLKNA